MHKVSGSPQHQAKWKFNVNTSGYRKVTAGALDQAQHSREVS